ncbi:hypothetical protein [Winogradskyella sp. R77965]|uniref:hypothetical protein n=1 Tax=Winogradskyella sp. R77965 TaxID=3093872 RepID=UPI0037DD2E46
MKKIFIITGALFFCSFLSAKNLEHSFATDIINGEYENSKKIETNSFLNVENVIDESSKAVSEAKVDCVIRITGTFDGVEVDVEITIHDVTRVGCFLLQTGIRAMEE